MEDIYTMYDVHHYETREIQDGNGEIIITKGLNRSSGLIKFTYTDAATGSNQYETVNNDPVTNYSMRI